jgi:hypothetical protein
MSVSFSQTSTFIHFYAIESSQLAKNYHVGLKLSATVNKPYMNTDIAVHGFSSSTYLPK